MRHQYVLFPFLLLLLPLTMDSLWRTLGARWLKTALIVIIIGATAINLARTLETHRIGEPAVAFGWNSEFAGLFADAQAEPTLIPAVSFFPLYYDRMKTGIRYQASYDPDRGGYHLAYQGWLALGMPWAAYQEYRVTTNDGGQATIIKDHYRWLFDPLPDELFFTQTRQLLERLGQPGVRVFALQTDPSIQQDEAELRTIAKRHGFNITEFTLLQYGALWRAKLHPVPSP